MIVPALMVRRVPVTPPLLEPLIFQPLISMGALVWLYSSMNSSLPPLGPLVRNSLITMWGPVGVGVRVSVGKGVAVMVTEVMTVGVNVGVGVADTPPGG